MRAKYSGHIPGAVNIDWRENFTTTTLLKDPVTLKTMYESKGVTQDKEVIAHCRTKIAHFKCPKTVEFGELPKTSTGKVQKFVLRDKEWAGHDKRIH